ncbi:transposase, partial [Acinetobacter baumannii]|uniref:transposase n=1 Tax=Acinetobacter baumannii TaxID=470 RepID=UPI001BB469D4
KQIGDKVEQLSFLNQKYEHVLALIKKHKFAQRNKHLTAKQIQLWDEAVEEDIAAVDIELERLNADNTNAATQKAKTNKPKRRLLPDHLHTIRTEHAPPSTHWARGSEILRIGEKARKQLLFRTAKFNNCRIFHSVTAHDHHYLQTR